MAKGFSDLNLNAQTPSRVQPKVGVWGPEGVPSTRHKKWLRWASLLAFLVALAVVVGWGAYLYFKYFKQG